MEAEADTPLARGYLPLAQQATMGVSGLPHSREAGRQLMFAVRIYVNEANFHRLINTPSSSKKL